MSEKDFIAVDGVITEKSEEIKKEYMYMLFFDTNITINEDEYVNGDSGIKNFWLYDSYDKAKNEMLGILEEFATSDEIIYFGLDEKIPVKSFARTLAKNWVDNIYYDFLYCKYEQDFKNTTIDRMINKLPDILSAYMKQERFDAGDLEECKWDDEYNHRIVIENERTPSLCLCSNWGISNELIISLENTRFIPDEESTGIYIYTNKGNDRIWLHLKIKRMEVNEPRV